MIEVTLENELSKIVSQKVQRGNYPPLPQPLDEQIRVKRNEIYNYKSEKIPRPSTKKEYLDLIASLEQEVKDLITQQGSEKSTYDAQCSVINNKYNEDITTAKLDPINIGEALAVCIDYQLTQTLWWTSTDCGLSASQRVITDSWRLNMMKVVYDYPVVADAVEQYNKILTAKPNYNIKFGMTDTKQITKIATAIEELKIVAAAEVAAEKPIIEEVPVVEIPKEETPVVETPVVEEPIIETPIEQPKEVGV